MEYLALGIGLVVGLTILGLLMAKILRLMLDAQRHEIETMRERLESNQQTLTALNADVLKNIGSIVDRVDTRLNDAQKSIREVNAALGGRMDRHYQTSVDTMQRVQKGLSEVGEAARKLMEVGKSISGLEDILKPPKTRGQIGETLLGRLLEEVLPTEHFSLQFRYPRSGVLVDAALLFGDTIIPVDSKFPIESFREVIAIEDEAARLSARKKFARAVRVHIDSIAEKYIRPEEHTSEFALMYIPAESVFYEMIVRYEEENSGNIQEYALSKKVVPVSPQSFFAYLMVIVHGLRGMKVEKHAEAILASLRTIGIDLDSIRADFQTLGNHLKNAQGKYDDVARKMGEFAVRIERISSREEEE